MLDEILLPRARPQRLVALVTLVVMEVVLGIDNLIFISILTNKLPEHQRSRARRIGIGLAVILRLGLLSGVAYIVQLTTPLFSVFGHSFSWRDLILIAGGLFLIYKATSEIHDHVAADHDTEAAGGAVQRHHVRRDRPDPDPRPGVLARQHHHRGRHDRRHPDHDRGRGDRGQPDAAGGRSAWRGFIGNNPTIVMLALGFLLMIGMTLIADGVGVKVPKGYIYAAMAFSAAGRGAEHAGSSRAAKTPAASATTALTSRRPALKLAAMKLKDRVAIVTGGASGIGAASARLFAAEGARLALVDQDEVGLGQVAADIEAAGGSAIIIPADVSSDAEARAGVDRVIEKWGRVDVLLTAAGMSTGGTVDTIEEAAWDRTFAVNVKGTYLWIHYAIKSMIENRSGAIVTIGSQLAQSSPGKNAAYVASKGAIASFTKTMAVDHAAQGIRINALMPGVIDTPMPARSLKRYADPEAMKAFWKHRHPMGRIGKPEEVARAALFLACDDSSFVTGTLLFVDGGWTAH